MTMEPARMQAQMLPAPTHVQAGPSAQALNHTLVQPQAHTSHPDPPLLVCISTLSKPPTWAWRPHSR